MSNVSIEVNHLTIGYPQRVVQRDICFSLQRGEFVCLLGPNGCGKSTLLRTITGLQPLLSGSFTPADVRHLVALVMTRIEALDSTTVHDVVAMGRYPYTSWLGKLTPEDDKVIAASLHAVGIEPEDELVRRPIVCCSDGERQRVLIAKAVAQQTPLLFLDEATAHLDLPNRLRIMQLLVHLAHDEGKTVLLSTHELDLALRFADRIMLMTPISATNLTGGVNLASPQSLRTNDALTRTFGMNVLDDRIQDNF